MATTKWKAIRPEFVKEFGGEAVVAEAHMRNETYIDAKRLAERRTTVLQACEAPLTARGSDRNRLAIVGSVDSESVWSVPADNGPSALEELVDVLDRAYEQQVIGADDRRLLLCLVEAAEGACTRFGGPGHGLLSNQAAEQTGSIGAWCVSRIPAGHTVDE